MRKILYLVGGVAVLGAAAVVAVFMFSGSIIKTVVEEVGTQATQAKVTLAEVSLSPLSGEGTLKGLTIGNPKGFKSPQAIKLGEVSLKVDPATVTNDVIVIKEVTIAGPDITYELGDAGGDNIRTIQKNAQAYASALSGGGAPAAKPASAPAPSSTSEKDAKEKKVIIENLFVRGGRVSVSASALGGKPLGTGLPDIHLANIGKSSGGATAAQVADQVIGALAKEAQAAVSKIGVDRLKGLAGGQADELMKKLGGKMPALGSPGGAAADKPAADPAGALNRLLGR